MITGVGDMDAAHAVKKNEKGGVNDVLWTRRRFPCF